MTVQNFSFYLSLCAPLSPFLVVSDGGTQGHRDTVNLCRGCVVDEGVAGGTVPAHREPGQ